MTRVLRNGVGKGLSNVLCVVANLIKRNFSVCCIVDSLDNLTGFISDQEIVNLVSRCLSIQCLGCSQIEFTNPDDWTRWNWVVFSDNRITNGFSIAFLLLGVDTLWILCRLPLKFERHFLVIITSICRKFALDSTFNS